MWYIPNSQEQDECHNVILKLHDAIEFLSLTSLTKGVHNFVRVGRAGM